MLIFKGFAVLWYVCAHCVMLCLKVMNDTKYVIFNDLQKGITQLVNMLEASKFHRNVNRIFFFPSDQITIPALTSGANVNLKKKRHNQHHRNRDKMRAIPNLPNARTAATVAREHPTSIGVFSIGIGYTNMNWNNFRNSMFLY